MGSSAPPVIMVCQGSEIVGLKLGVVYISITELLSTKQRLQNLVQKIRIDTLCGYDFLLFSIL
jgi:hypothetical protein